MRNREFVVPAKAGPSNRGRFGSKVRLRLLDARFRGHDSYGRTAGVSIARPAARDIR